MSKCRAFIALLVATLAAFRLVIADSKRSYTRAFARYVLELTKVMTLKDVALLLGVGWDCVKDILKRNLAQRFARPKLDNSLVKNSFFHQADKANISPNNS